MLFNALKHGIMLLFNALKHGIMRLFIARDLSVKVGNKLQGAFCRIVDGREAIDQPPEILKIGIVFPFNRRVDKKLDRICRAGDNKGILT